MLLMSTKKRTFFALLVAGAAVSVLAGYQAAF